METGAPLTLVQTRRRKHGTVKRSPPPVVREQNIPNHGPLSKPRLQIKTDKPAAQAARRPHKLEITPRARHLLSGQALPDTERHRKAGLNSGSVHRLQQMRITQQLSNFFLRRSGLIPGSGVQSPGETIVRLCRERLNESRLCGRCAKGSLRTPSRFKSGQFQPDIAMSGKNLGSSLPPANGLFEKFRRQPPPGPKRHGYTLGFTRQQAMRQNSLPAEKTKTQGRSYTKRSDTASAAGPAIFS